MLQLASLFSFPCQAFLDACYNAENLPLKAAPAFLSNMGMILQKLKVRGSAREVRGEPVAQTPSGSSNQGGGQGLQLSSEALTNLMDKAKELDAIKATMADKGHLLHGGPTSALTPANSMPGLLSTKQLAGVPAPEPLPLPALPQSQAAEKECQPENDSNEATKSLEDYEKDAMDKITRNKANALDASMKRPAAKKPAAQTKAVPKPKVIKNEKKHAQRTKHVTPAFLKQIYGCIRCRGNVAGCDVCWSPFFAGKRFSSRAEYNKWYQQKQTKDKK